MLKLKQGESYLWALPFVWGGMVLCAIASVAVTGSVDLGMLAFPLAMVLLRGG